jgi:hypothetical protein
MSSGEKITLNNIHGKDVEVTAAQVGDLIATLQCLPEAIENGSGDDLEHTAGVLKQRLEDMGITFDRRETEDYQSEIADDLEVEEGADEAPKP